MEKNLEFSFLLDFYGDLLTDKQKEFTQYYYNQDLSLSEISANQGISRQGVRSIIKKAEANLIEFESRVGFAKKYKNIELGLKIILDEIDKIKYQLGEGHISSGTQDSISKIKSIIERLL